MSSLRYKLRKQIHFIAADPGNPRRNVVVTLQRWQSKTSNTTIYVRLHDGREFARHHAATAEQLAMVDRSFANAATFPLLSEEGATDEIVRRGGPNPTFCHLPECGAQVPYAAAQCAEGHPLHQTPAGTYVFGDSRLPSLTLRQGGRR